MLIRNIIYDNYKHSLGTKYTLIFFSSAHDGVHEDNIINAAMAFNKQFVLKHWIIHYDVSLNTRI